VYGVGRVGFDHVLKCVQSGAVLQRDRRVRNIDGFDAGLFGIDNGDHADDDHFDARFVLALHRTQRRLISRAGPAIGAEHEPK